MTPIIDIVKLAAAIVRRGVEDPEVGAVLEHLEARRISEGKAAAILAAVSHETVN